MHLSEIKIFNKISRLKSSSIKVGILMSLLAYWGIISNRDGTKVRKAVDKH